MALRDIFEAPLPEEGREQFARERRKPSGISEQELGRFRRRIDYSEMSYKDRLVNAAVMQDWNEMPELRNAADAQFGREQLLDRINRRAQAVAEFDYEMFPDGYSRNLARKAWTDLPVDALVGMLTSESLSDEGVIGSLFAWQQEYGRQQAEKDMNQLSPDLLHKYKQYVRLGGDEAQALAAIENDVPDEEFQRLLGARVFGAMDEVARQQGTVPGEMGLDGALNWMFDQVEDNTVVEKLIETAELPARGIDWLAREAAKGAGSDVDPDTTAGQLAARGAGMDPDGLGYRLVSGGLDTIKLFFADAFVIGGKFLKTMRSAKGIDDVSKAMKLSEHMGIDRFAKYLDAVPKEQRAGMVSRAEEMFGWNVVDKNFYARVAQGDGVQGIKEAIEQGMRRREISTAPIFPRYGKARIEGDKLADQPGANLGRGTWTGQMDTNDAMFERHFRRMGDFLSGDQRRADQYLTRILEANTRPQKAKLAKQMSDDMLADWATKHGVDQSVVDEAKDLLRRTGSRSYWERSSKFVALAHDEIQGSRVLESAALPVHMRRWVDVPEYGDMLELERAVRWVSKRRGVEFPLKAREALRQTAEGTHNLAKRFWLANPALGMKITGEETAWFAGDVGIRRYMQAFADDTLPWMQKLSDEHLKILDEAVEEGPPLPYTLSGSRALYFDPRSSTSGFGGLRQSEKGIARNLKKSKSVDYGIAEKTEATYDYAYYDVVNNHILKDRVGRFLLQHGDDADRGIPQVKRWMTDTEEGRFFVNGKPDPPQVKGLKGREKLEAKADIFAKDAADFLDYHIPRDSHLLREIAKTGRVDLEDVQRFRGELPEKVAGPLFESLQGGTNLNPLRGLENAIWKANGAMVDGVVRRPAWRAYLRQEIEAQARFSDELVRLGEEAIPLQRQKYRAINHATKKMARFENPMERTRAGERMRNWILFLDPQINFQKRWAKLSKDNPGYVSRLRRMLPAGENLGLVQRDEETGAVHVGVPVDTEYWKWFFTEGGEHPATEFMTGLWFRLGRTGRLTGGPASLLSAPFQIMGQAFVPQSVPFAFQNDLSFAPLQEVPAQLAMNAKPTWREHVESIFGEYTAMPTEDQSWADILADSFSAAWMRTMSGAALGPEGDRIAASSLVDYMKWLSLQDESHAIFDPERQDEMRDNAASTIKWMTLFRGLTQFALPYNLSANPHTREAFDEYRKTLDEAADFQEGIKNYLDEHGAAGIPMTVSKSESVMEDIFGEKRERVVGLPPTTFGLEFLRENKDFVDQYPDVAGIFMMSPEDEYEPSAFLEQIQLGYRDSLEAQKWLRMVSVTAGQRLWYDNIQPRLEEIEEEVGREEASALRDAFRERMNEQFPGWDQYQAKGAERAQLREDAVGQLREALQEPTVRDRPDVQPIKEWLALYDRAAQRREQEMGLKSWQSDRLDPVKRYLENEYKRMYEETGSEALRAAYEQLFRSQLRPPP